MNIIVADSSNYTRSRIVKLISPMAYFGILRECFTVPETIEACAQSQPDALIMAYQLIGGNSMDILETLKPKTIKPLVIVLGDSLYPQIKQQYIQAGADYVFDKATEFATLPKVLADCLHNSPAAART